MQLPFELSQAIEILAQGHKLSELQAASARLSQTYRGGANSREPFHDPLQMLAYLVTRVPATFAAAHAVFTAIRERLGSVGSRLLDLGAGPGSASWAVLSVFPEIAHVTLLERESAAVAVGQQLARGTALEAATWITRSLETNEPWPKVDIAVLSYVLGELPTLSERLLNADIPLIAVIEPGTPQGFERIRTLRSLALERGATIVAPCPHAFACPMQGTNWCHFPARVERTRLHRQLKGGTLGFEDEKFSYVVIANPSSSLPELQGRVVGPPQISKGFVRLPLCANDGQLREVVVSRKDKERYRTARDADWGSGM